MQRYTFSCNLQNYFEFFLPFRSFFLFFAVFSPILRDLSLHFEVRTAILKSHCTKPVEPLSYISSSLSDGKCMWYLTARRRMAQMNTKVMMTVVVVSKPSNVTPQ